MQAKRLIQPPLHLGDVRPMRKLHLLDTAPGVGHAKLVHAARSSNGRLVPRPCRLESATVVRQGIMIGTNRHIIPLTHHWFGNQRDCLPAQPKESPILLLGQAYGPASMTDYQSLVEQARRAALAAYAPYSGFSVGCAVESDDGEIVLGSNMENACYRLGVCAELSALTAASQKFGLGKIARIAVTGGHVGSDGSLAGASVVTSCGGCRQSILEAAHVSGNDIEVISSNGDGTEVQVLRISELLPLGFGPGNLEDAGS